jgi:hypothetical protein
MAAVRAKLEESAKLAAILDDVFSEDDSVVAPAAATVDVETTTKLPIGHALLLTKLLERPQWARGEFEQAAQALGLMPDGALDALNEASFEHIGAPILEGEDPIDLDSQAAKELLA